MPNPDDPHAPAESGTPLTAEQINDVLAATGRYGRSDEWRKAGKPSVLQFAIIEAARVARAASPSPAGEAPAPERGEPLITEQEIANHWHDVAHQQDVEIGELRAALDAERETGILEIPAGIELQIVNYATAIPGGRADDTIIHLTAADKTYLGMLSLGWFREHTSVGYAERDVLAGSVPTRAVTIAGGAE